MLKGLRELVYLRRIARALEDIAKSQRALALMAADDWKRRHPATPPKPTDFGVMDIGEVNKQYHARREAQAAGVETE
jgi:hypothetical protein